MAGAGRAVDEHLRAIEFEGMLLGRHLSPVHRPGGDGPVLERSAYTLLNRLERQGPMSTGELSEAFGLDVSTLHRQTTAMMRDGLVERIPDPDGGMARKFRVTAEGRRKLESDRRIKLGGLAKVLEDWPPEDVAALATLLGRFNLDIERRDGRPWPRPDGPSTTDAG